MKKAILIAGAAAIAVAIPAIAAQVADGPGPRMMMQADMTRAQVEAMVKDKFAMADTNKDGAVTMEEINAARTARHAQRMDDRFKAMDTNTDGSISRAEFDSAHERMMGQMAPGDGPGMGAGMGPGHQGMGQGGPGMMHGGPGMGGPGMMHGMGKGGPGMMGHGGAGMGMKFGPRMFERADANKDGKVTLAEANKAALAHFDEVDANKNGTVTAQERMDFWKSKRADWMKEAKPGS